MTTLFHPCFATLVLCASQLAAGCGEREVPTAPTAPAPVTALTEATLEPDASRAARVDAVAPLSVSASRPTTGDTTSVATDHDDIRTSGSTERPPTIDAVPVNAQPNARLGSPLDDTAVIAAYVAITCAQKAGRAAQLASLYETHGLADRTAWQTLWRRASSDVALVRRATEKAAATCP